MVVTQVGFVRVGRVRRQKNELGQVGRVEADPQRTDVGCLKPSCDVSSTLTGPILRYAHLVPKGPETVRRKTLGLPSATLSVVDIFSRLIFPEMMQSRTK